MHSPPAEWSLLAAYFIALDVLRARGETDRDTLSECVREGFRIHTPRGRALFTVTLAAGAVAFHRHICKEVAW